MQTLTGYICVATCFHRVHQLLKFFKLSTFISKQKREEHGWVLLNQQFSLSLVLFIFSQEYAEVDPPGDERKQKKRKRLEN